MIKIIQGNCLDSMKTLPDNFVDAIVTDPPYGLSFMGKKWDYDVPKKEIWEEALRVLKPGGYLLSFAGTRTQHRMAVNIEDAGFEIRDMIAWVYGSGFPKSHNIGKAVDKLQGNEREVTGKGKPMSSLGVMHDDDWKSDGAYNETKGSSPYEGWGTALKPALEPITVARKPLSEKTVAENVLKWGTGGINIDGSRVGTESITTNGKGKQDGNTPIVPQSPDFKGETRVGRFPANFIHDGSDEVVGLFPDTTSPRVNNPKNGKTSGNSMNFGNQSQKPAGEMFDYRDSGSAARYFYCAKASKSDRNEGLEGFEEKEEVYPGINTFDDNGNRLRADGSIIPPLKSKNNHPTVKPTKLMQYLVKLVTPKGGVCLDPFMGSGSTGKACKLEGFDFIGIEMDEEYCKIANARINAVTS